MQAEGLSRSTTRRAPTTALRRLALLAHLIVGVVVASCSPAVTATATVPALIRAADAWIEVDIDRQKVVLHANGKSVAEYPASTAAITDPDQVSPPGVYRVQSKEEGPVEGTPDVFVVDLIMFDLGRGNGIHSRPMDAESRILDETLGVPTTAGCVRVAESARVFEFAELGMRVWLH